MNKNLEAVEQLKSVLEKNSKVDNFSNYTMGNDGARLLRIANKQASISISDVIEIQIQKSDQDEKQKEQLIKDYHDLVAGIYGASICPRVGVSYNIYEGNSVQNTTELAVLGGMDGYARGYLSVEGTSHHAIMIASCTALVIFLLFMLIVIVFL